MSIEYITHRSRYRARGKYRPVPNWLWEKYEKQFLDVVEGTKLLIWVHHNREIRYDYVLEKRKGQWIRTCIECDQYDHTYFLWDSQLFNVLEPSVELD